MKEFSWKAFFPVVAGLTVAGLFVFLVHLIFFSTPIPDPSKKGIFSMEAIAFVLLMAAFIRSEIIETLIVLKSPDVPSSRGSFKFKDALLVLFVLAGSILIYAAALNLLHVA